MEMLISELMDEMADCFEEARADPAYVAQLRRLANRVGVLEAEKAEREANESVE